MKDRAKFILAIDDDDVSNYLTQCRFEEMDIDCEIIFHTRAKDALNYLKEHQDNFPDVILLDINMPEMTGWDFLEEYLESCYENHEDTVVLMLSTSLYANDQERAKSYPCVKDYLEKPLTSEFLNRIKDQLFIAK